MINPGEHIALVGPTGSGKTTIIRLLCRLYEPQSGQILIDDVDIKDIPIATLRICWEWFYKIPLSLVEMLQITLTKCEY